jgi:DNA-binding transcriptional MocR family regulator
MAEDTISFARGAPSADILPKEAVRDAAARALAEDWQKALSYGTGIGHPASAGGWQTGTGGSTTAR